jgi:voltage-gated potassium channel
MTTAGTSRRAVTSSVTAAERRRRRRALLRTLLTPLFATVVLLVLYYRLPMDRSLEGSTALALGLGLLAVAVLIAIQVRQITRSSYPRLRAIGALSTSIPLFLLVFAVTYFMMAQARPDAFSEALGRTDALYFTVTVFSTVGFGDITPVIQAARVVAMFQMIGDLILIGLIGRVVVSAVNAGLQRRTMETEPDS